MAIKDKFKQVEGVEYPKPPSSSSKKKKKAEPTPASGPVDPSVKMAWNSTKQTHIG
jgi:hypothetical protein